jgi:Uma2 family endonuclease
MVAKPSAATYEDLLKLPPNKVGEILFGVLYAFPRPAIPHASASTALTGVLFNPFHRGKGGPGGWIILDDPELHLRSDIVVPDLAGWKRERLPEAPDAAFITLAPDWICEIVSPSTEAIDRTDKMSIYAREKVSRAWLIDPVVQTLEIFRLDGETWRMITTFRGRAGVRAEPFDAIELELAALWDR